MSQFWGRKFWVWDYSTAFPASTKLFGGCQGWWSPKQLLEFLSSPGQYKMDPVVLSYMDSLLWQSDFSLLDPPSWLNVHAIGFAFKYFSSSQFHVCSDHVCVISPEVTQFIKCTGSPAESAMFLEPLDLPSNRVIFLAINEFQPHSWGNPLELFGLSTR